MNESDHSDSGDETSEEYVPPVLLNYGYYNSESDDDMPELEDAHVIQELPDMPPMPPQLSINDCELDLCTDTKKCEWCLYKNSVSVARPITNFNENNERLVNLTENNCYQYGFRNDNGINVVDITDSIPAFESYQYEMYNNENVNRIVLNISEVIENNTQNEIIQNNNQNETSDNEAIG